MPALCRDLSSLAIVSDCVGRKSDEKHTASASGLQVIAEHKLWVQGKDLAGRIYLSTQGINAQYSGLTADAEGYAMWLQQQDLFKVCF